MFVCRQKVLFQHCDPAGIVFYPRYFEMINATVEEWFSDRLDFGFEIMHGKLGVAVPTAALQITFTAPSMLGDMLDFRLKATRLGRSSLDLMIEAFCGDEKRLSMTSTLVFTKRGAGKSEPWPDGLRQKISDEIN
ncbi:MAG: thioesterase family protein [Pseudomonadota bacterium]